jgi:type IV pilus assembly protein PilM
MSPRTRIITLNLGSQSLEMAVFRTQPPDGLTLCGYRSRELLADSTREANRHANIVAALRQMLDELQLKGGNVYYTIAEEAVFTRFVKLPPIGEEKIERIISFEAQQNVPFPIDEVVWDYQLVGSGAGMQIQVILVAIKADLLEEINAAVEETGLRTSVVDLATMALYNAFCFNYSDLNGCSLLVDIGARTTNLLFIEPGRIFTRSVPIGGSSVTSAIAKEFNEPFPAAEFRKKCHGSPGLGGALAELADGEGERVSRIILGTMTRLHAELMRSINHYCAQQKGNLPERVFLSGGGAGMPCVREFFHEKLQLPVEFFNPLRQVALADAAASEEVLHSKHLLGEPVGLALRAATDCPMKLNLCPVSVVRRLELVKRRPFLIAAAVCVFLSLLGWGVYYAHDAGVLRRRAEGVQEQVDVRRRIESQLNEVRRQTAALDRVAAPLVDAINDRSFWPRTIEEMNARMPAEDIWITELVATSGGKPLSPSSARPGPTEADHVPTPSPLRPGPAATPPVVDGLLVRGLYLFNPKQQEVVVDYFRNLAGSSWFSVDPNNQAKVIRPTTPTNTEWAFPYELRLDLRQPVKLP